MVGRAIHVVPGGTAIQAIGLARLGVASTLVAPRANDLAGRVLAEQLRQEGVPWVGPTAARTAATAVLSSSVGVAMATAPADGEPSAGDVAAVGADAVVLSIGRASLRPPGVRACFVTGQVEVDAGVRPPASTGRGDVLVVNEREALALTEEPDAERAARTLGRDVETAIVTTGTTGAIGVRGDTLVRSPAPDVDVVDATGAGDLFVSAIVWTTTRALDLERALAWACLAAGLSVAAPTALAGARTIDELLAEGRRRGLTPP
ncbi:MAG TPA: PfkB family carbohydrate kinase [Actinomycetota bacterium]|nr:PfkB family carbohydrate kinase [Actinomycetota bacterium]